VQSLMFTKVRDCDLLIVVTSSTFLKRKDMLRWGWVFLKRMRILSGIQFTTHFIEIFVAETKQFVSSFVNVILIRQTCGQRSNRAAESKRRALENCFSERICYMFLITKCRGDRDLGTVHNFGICVRRTDAQWRLPKKTCFDAGKIRFCHCAPNARAEVVHRPSSRSPLHFDIRNI